MVWWIDTAGVHQRGQCVGPLPPLSAVEPSDRRDLGCRARLSLSQVIVAEKLYNAAFLCVSIGMVPATDRLGLLGNPAQLIPGALDREEVRATACGSNSPSRARSHRCSHRYGGSVPFFRGRKFPPVIPLPAPSNWASSLDFPI